MTDTLKSVCAQCVHLLKPQLNFIPEEPQRHREIILRDLNELVSAASLEQTKTVIVMAGCLFESVLYCFIHSQHNYISHLRGAPFTLRADHSLSNYVNIFNRYFSKMFTIPDIVIAYRSMVHITQELGYAPEACSRAAGEMLTLLNDLIGKLAEFAGSE